MANPTLVNYRFDPFTGADQSLSITGEAHTIPGSSPYYVQLDEVPREDNPSTVSISGYTEVSGAPAALEFQVDYTYKTGLIRFNAADANDNITVDYEGTGHPNRAGYMNALKDGTGMDADSILAGHIKDAEVGQAEIGANAVGQSELKNSTGSASGSLAASSTLEISTNDWAYIYFFGGSGDISFRGKTAGTNGITIKNENAKTSQNYDIRWRILSA